MDFCSGMQKALDYIEEHITGELDYEKIAKQACFFGSQFQRIFGVLCGCTLGEYIRKRRLTLAGAERLLFHAMTRPKYNVISRMSLLYGKW